MIGNNFASFRSNDQPGPKNYRGGNYIPENNKGLGGIQEGLTLIRSNRPLNPTFGVGEGWLVESMIEQTIRSLMNRQHGGLRERQDYSLASVGSSTESHQNIGEGPLGSFLKPANQDGEGRNLSGPIVGSPLEYPHSSNYGGAHNVGAGGGYWGSGGGGSGGSNPPGTNNDLQQVPEPSTFILTAIGLLLVTRRAYKNKGQGVESRQRREKDSTDTK